MQKMDLSVALMSKKNASVDESKAGDGMVQSKWDKFMSTYLQQNFALPDSIVYYIAKNPTTAAVYQKLIESCKYFFVKNPVIVVSNMANSDGKWRVGESHFTYGVGVGGSPFDFTKLTCKLWMVDEFVVKTANQNLVSSIIPKLYRCDANKLWINHQTISYDELRFLVSSAADVMFHNVTVKSDDGSTVDVEKIVEAAVNAKDFSFQQPSFTSTTMKELLKIPHFSKINYFAMTDLTDVFDLETFYVYMKKNKTTQFWFTFDDSISAAYKNQLEKIIDEILATTEFSYKPAFILFRGLSHNKSYKLDRLTR